MQQVTSRGAMLAGLLFGLASNPARNLIESLRRDSPSMHEAVPHHRGRRGTRYRGVPRIRRPAPYSQPSPKSVTGVRLRWAAGKLVPRDTQVMGLPLRKRQAERLARQRRKIERPKKPRPANGGYRRGDMQGAMRAARRAGIISARQQRRIHRNVRNARAGLTSQHLRAMLEHPDAREVLES